jgi:Dyp-type peroxidase family
MNRSVKTQARGLDLADIQGNIVRPYGRFGFPFTRHLFFHIGNPEAGRQFVGQVRNVVTSAERWAGTDGDTNPNLPARPTVAVNIGFSFMGLYALELPTRTLRGLPEEFQDGMASRWSILGDFGPSGRDKWDPIWRNGIASREQQIHIWVSLNAQCGQDGKPVPELETKTAALEQWAVNAQGVTLLTGHKGPNPKYQDSAALTETLEDGTATPVAKEHFGYTDGIADPVFTGQYERGEEAAQVLGSGKIRATGPGWDPLAAGEFILGLPSEAQELPPAAPPWSFTRNGTFMAYRKLHQNIDAFNHFIEKQAALLLATGGAATRIEAAETIKAKIAGRWQWGVPLTIAPTYAEAVARRDEWADIPALQRKGANRTEADKARLDAYGKLLTDFRYQGDSSGGRCPVGAHIRRVNPRDSLDPDFATKDATIDSSLTNRRRILRRGTPYGSKDDPHGEHGVIFMAVCASLFGQFEFVQQQWVNYGASFNSGNDTDPLAGYKREGAKFVINADAPAVPFICANIPQFVETRGGEYFFLPSLTALRQIAQGSIDPT